MDKAFFGTNRVNDIWVTRPKSIQILLMSAIFAFMIAWSGEMDDQTSIVSRCDAIPLNDQGLQEHFFVELNMRTKRVRRMNESEAQLECEIKTRWIDRGVCECHFSVSHSKEIDFSHFPKWIRSCCEWKNDTQRRWRSFKVLVILRMETRNWTGKSGSQRWCAQRTQWIVSYYMQQWKKISNQKFASLRHFCYYYYFFVIFSIKLCAICPWCCWRWPNRKMSPKEMETVAMKNVELRRKMEWRKVLGNDRCIDLQQHDFIAINFERSFRLSPAHRHQRRNLCAGMLALRSDTPVPWQMACLVAFNNWNDCRKWQRRRHKSILLNSSFRSWRNQCQSCTRFVEFPIT